MTSEGRFTTASTSLEIESANNNDFLNSTDRGPTGRIAAVARYAALTLLAVAATATCPGGTVLWVHGVQWWIFARLILSTILTLTGFLLVNGSDPGFLTAELLDELREAAWEEEALVGSDESGAFNPLAPPSSNTDVEDPAIATNFPAGTRRHTCEMCQLAPLIRSHHCKECHRCVATFDHHCKLVGVCIGERNRARFWWFLLAQWYGFATCCYIVGSSRLGLLTLVQPGNEAVLWDILRVVAAKVYLYPLTMIATIMLALHSFLALTNMTTFECVKGPRHLEYLKGTSDMDLPFSQGVCYNLKSYGCHFGDCCDQGKWTPIVWRPPGKIVRDSEEWWNHPWQNKYWSCC